MQYQILIREWMTPDPITAREDMSLMGAFDLMKRRNIRRLPVIAGDTLVGIVTRSDIQQLIPCAEDQMFALAGRTVDEIMTRNPVTITPEQDIKDAAEEMIEHRVSGLPVVDGDRLVGIITESDIFRLVVNSWAEISG